MIKNDLALSEGNAEMAKAGYKQPKIELSKSISDEIKTTTCYMCACRCGIKVYLKDNKVKYLTDSQPGFVYGLDEQSYNKVFCILCEGPIDAIHVDGCALLGSEISEQQSLLLNRLQKDIIIVPDRDKAGKKLVEQAIELGYQVSMPEWSQDITDIGEAVSKYGRLYTLHSIAVAAEESALKIRLRAKKWFI